jgi:hypothetical protein
MDRREDILSAHAVSSSNGEYLMERDEAHLAMDEYFTERAYELLEYMAKNLVICGHYSSSDGLLFKVKGRELMTKEQLFENFL